MASPNPAPSQGNPHENHDHADEDSLRKIRRDLLDAVKRIQIDRSLLETSIAAQAKVPGSSSKTKESYAISLKLHNALIAKHNLLISLVDQRLDELRQVNMSISGIDLPKMDMFGLSDPYFIISRPSDAQTDLLRVYQSPVLTKTLNPTWPIVSIPARTLCGNGASFDTPLTIEVYDFNKGIKDDFIGSTVVSLKDILASSGEPLILSNNALPAKQLGKLQISHATVVQHDHPTSLDMGGAGPSATSKGRRKSDSRRGSQGEPKRKPMRKGSKGPQGSSSERILGFGEKCDDVLLLTTEFLASADANVEVQAINDDIRVLERQLFAVQERQNDAGPLSWKKVSEELRTIFTSEDDLTSSPVENMLSTFPVGVEAANLHCFISRYYDLASHKVITASAIADFDEKHSFTCKHEHLPAYNYSDPLDIKTFISALRLHISAKLEDPQIDDRHIETVIGRHLFPPLHQKIMAICGTPSEDRAIAEQCNKFRDVTMEQFRLDFVSETVRKSPRPLGMAIAKLRASYLSQTPTRKFHAIYSAAQSMLDELDSPSLTDEQFLRVWTFVVLKANVHQLGSMISFLDELLAQPLLSSEMGFYFRLLRQASEFIQSMSDSDLAFPLDVKEKKIIVFEKARYSSWVDMGPHFHIDATPVKIPGYRMYAAMEWIWEPAKFYSVVVTPSDNPYDSVTGYVLTCSRDASEAQKVLLNKIFVEPDVDGIEATDTVHGMMLVANLPKLTEAGGSAQGMSFLQIPHGSYVRAMPTIRNQLNLLRLSCAPKGAGTSTVTLSTPIQWQKRFRQMYPPAHYPPVDAVATGSKVNRITSVVRILQVLLYLLDRLPVFQKCDGRYGAFTLGGVDAVHRALVAAQGSGDGGEGSTVPEDSIPGAHGFASPQLFATLRQDVYSAAQQLRTLGFLGDACDPVRQPDAFMAAVRVFQTSAKLTPDGKLGVKTVEQLIRLAPLETVVPAEASAPADAATSTESKSDETRKSVSPYHSRAIPLNTIASLKLTTDVRGYYEGHISQVITCQRHARRWLILQRFRNVAKVYKTSPLTAKLRKRNKIYAELVHTETSYVRHLRVVVDSFLKPLHALVGTRKEVLTAQEIKDIFSIIENILAVNDQFLALLRARYKLWPTRQDFGDIFLKMADFFKMYTVYVNNYDATLATLAKLGEHKKFSAFIEGKKQEANGLELSSLLIMPVQRIPRYGLLLREIQKYTSPDHVDYERISQACGKIGEIASHINEKKREAENQLQTLYIARKLYATRLEMSAVIKTLVAPHRQYITDGHVNVIGEKKPHRCWLFLFNDLLLYATLKNSGRWFRLEQVFKLGDIQLIDVEEGPGAGMEFRIDRTGEASFFVRTDSAEDKGRWYEAIQAEIRAFNSRRQTFAFDLHGVKAQTGEASAWEKGFWRQTFKTVISELNDDPAHTPGEPHTSILELDESERGEDSTSSAHDESLEDESSESVTAVSLSTASEENVTTQGDGRTDVAEDETSPVDNDSDADTGDDTATIARRHVLSRDRASSNPHGEGVADAPVDPSQFFTTGTMLKGRQVNSLEDGTATAKAFQGILQANAMAADDEVVMAALPVSIGPEVVPGELSLTRTNRDRKRRHRRSLSAPDAE